MVVPRLLFFVCGRGGFAWIIAQRQLHSRPDDRRIAGAAVGI